MEVKAVLDTNAYTHYEAGYPQAIEFFVRTDRLYLPVITVGELHYGFRNGSRFQENSNRLDNFIRKFDVEIIEVDLEVARHFGELNAAIRRKGNPIPTNDIWIAACCLKVRGTLLTANRHFASLHGLDVRFLQPKQ